MRLGITIFRWRRWLAAGMALAGLAGFPGTPRAFGAPGAENVFRASPILPPDVRRVAVLPLTCEAQSGGLPEGCETLQPVLLSELTKTKKFEVVSVNPEDLRTLTGRLAWTGSEALPPNFLEGLQREYGCDAVLFCELSEFRAYAPLAVGWRLKLVDVRTHQILWAADEVFDATQQPRLGEVNRWQAFMRQILPTTTGTEDAWLQANSPRRFGKMALTKLLATLPDRPENTKVSWQATDVPSERTMKKTPPGKLYGD